MSEKDSLRVYPSSKSLDKDIMISVPENHLLIWLDFSTNSCLSTSCLIYPYLWEKVNLSIHRFTECNACYSYILTLQEREEKVFLVITDPIKPLVQKNLFILWAKLLFESHVAKIYIIQTQIDVAFYCFWFEFKQQQQIFFIPDETSLLQQLNQHRDDNTLVIYLETGTSEIFELDKFQFNELFSNHIKCFNYIISNRHRQMILVVNSQNSDVLKYRLVIRDLFSTQYYIYMFSKLSSIYILTSSRTKQVGIKRTDMFKSCELFQKQFEEDISPKSLYFCKTESVYSSPRETLQISLQSVSRQRFVYYTNIIVKLPQTNEEKTEIIEECRDRYNTDRSELDKIDKFVDNYYEQKKHTAIWWYTQDSFLYRLLNEACRTEDIDLILAFRSFISDLFKQLEEEHKTFLDSTLGMTITVYRGQLISLTEVNHLRKNIGQLFLTNTFLSATAEFLIALVFAQKDNLSNLESVIFEFHVDTSTITNRPYADIRVLSSKRSEEEFLFCIGTAFRIKSIEEKRIENNDDETNKYWHIVLEHVNENDDFELANQHQKLPNSFENEPILIKLGLIAQYTSRTSYDFTKAEQYFRLYLDEVFTAGNNENIDYKSLITAYDYLGKICQRKGDYAASVEYNEHIITICSTRSSTILNMTEYERMNTIVYQYKRMIMTCGDYAADYDSAAKACNELFEYLQRSDDPCSKCVTSVLNTLGEVYKKQNHWLKASECYERAYLLNSNNIYCDTSDRDIVREKVLQIQNRFPETIFFVLVMIWCCSYLFDIFNIDQMIKQDIMLLAFIRLIIYYLMQRATIELTYDSRMKVKRINILIDKILKKIRNTRLYQYKQDIFTYFYQFVPSFISIWTSPSFLFTDRNTLNRPVFGFIFGIILLAAYLPIVFILITRILMIWFITVWLSDLHLTYWLILTVSSYYLSHRISFVLFNFIFLLLFELKVILRQKRPLLNTNFLPPIDQHPHYK